MFIPATKWGDAALAPTIRRAWANGVTVVALDRREEDVLTTRSHRRRADSLPADRGAQQGARPKTAGQSQAGMTGQPGSTTRESRPITFPTQTTRHHAGRSRGSLGGRGGLFFRRLRPHFEEALGAAYLFALLSFLAWCLIRVIR